MLAKVLHVDTELFVLSNLQSAFGAHVGVNQQVLHLLVVDFEDRERDLEAMVFVL